MRGLVRADKQKAIELLQQGITPSQVSKTLDIPLSTITTWNIDVRKERRPAAFSPVNKREILKNAAKQINIAEAKIMNAVAEISNPNISDDEWFDVQEVITKQLQQVVLETCYLETTESHEVQETKTVTLESPDQKPVIKHQEQKVTKVVKKNVITPFIQPSLFDFD